MRRFIAPVVVLLFLTRLSFASDIEDFLSARKDLTYEKIITPKTYNEAFKLRIKQPLDHSDTTKGFFFQTVFLSHKNKEAVTAIITEGYSRSRNYIDEITSLVGGNQLAVEHRYFGESVPDSIDYTYLNLEQATADLHHIHEIFKTFYANSWLSSGISKGGQTTIFYRYFYPQDAQAWVPYVAPFNLSMEDKRIYAFFDTIGTKECRDAIAYTQKRVLMARDTLLPILKAYTGKSGMQFNYLSLEQAFEYMVLEYPFSFWQWGYSCSDIPMPGEKLEDLISHMLRVCDINFFDDQSMKMYASHYYQAATEMGYYGYELDGLKKYIKALPSDSNPLATFPPNKMPLTFQDSLVKKVFDWLKVNGNNMIYIYGGIDTWSATMVPPSDSTNSVWFKLYNRNHRTARIKNMNDAELKLLVKTLDKWLDIRIKKKNIKMLTKAS
jgi:hypothetical protein